MNAFERIEAARMVVGMTIDHRCNEELKRAAREAETTRRSFGQLHRSDRWIRDNCTTQPTKPAPPIESRKNERFGFYSGLWRTALMRMTRTRFVGSPGSSGMK